jgi:hypothetical protein
VIPLSKLAREICRAVGHDTDDVYNACSRCGLGRVAGEIKAHLDSIFVGRKMQEDTPYHMRMHAQAYLEEAVREGRISDYHGLSISQDNFFPAGYIVDFHIVEDGYTYRSQLRIF